jgi:GDPmannose 4,6-dehydratase
MTNKKCAIITGIYGQDGSLLAEYLLKQDYKVVGLVGSIRDVVPIPKEVTVIEADLTNIAVVKNIFRKEIPDECYHLAAVHHSSEKDTSFNGYLKMLEVNFISTQIIIEAIIDDVPKCKLLYAGSSQMYTASSHLIVDEATPYNPSTYYGITKVASANLIDLMRRNRCLWGSTAILFNHESTRRGGEFISRKITLSAASNKKILNEQKKQKQMLHIKNIYTKVDWSSASDVIEAMYLALQAEKPKDYILSSGVLHSVEQLLDIAYGLVGLDWHDYVILSLNQADKVLSQSSIRGNSSLARSELGWMPKETFESLISKMVMHDLDVINNC